MRCPAWLIGSENATLKLQNSFVWGKILEEVDFYCRRISDILSEMEWTRYRDGEQGSGYDQGMNRRVKNVDVSEVRAYF